MIKLLREIFTDSKGKLSSKRVLGVLGLLSFGALAIISGLRASFAGVPIDPELVAILRVALPTSAGLIGVGVFEKG